MYFNQVVVSVVVSLLLPKEVGRSFRNIFNIEFVQAISGYEILQCVQEGIHALFSKASSSMEFASSHMSVPAVPDMLNSVGFESCRI